MKAIYFYYANQEFEKLSNFYPSPLRLEGSDWPTIEHYFQAMKTLDPVEREKIRRLGTPGQAKRAGRKVTLRADWEQIKDSVMKQALVAKFTQNEHLKDLLLSTGTAELHEDSPHDMYWGVKGRDRLGQLLMEIRKEIRIAEAGDLLCPKCQEAELMTGRNKSVHIDVSNTHTSTAVCLEVHAKVCPNCRHTTIHNPF